MLKKFEVNFGVSVIYFPVWQFFNNHYQHLFYAYQLLFLSMNLDIILLES